VYRTGLKWHFSFGSLTDLPKKSKKDLVKNSTKAKRIVAHVDKCCGTGQLLYGLIRFELGKTK
jgi:hypothetical protein